MEDTIAVTEVVISAQRPMEETGLNLVHVDSTILSVSSNSDLSELLSRHSNLHIKSYGKGMLSTISFRGTAASHTKIQWNGLELNSPMLGQVDFSSIPTSIIDEMSIYYGGSSLSHTSGALGGSIQIDNKPSWATRPIFDANLEYGSFNTFRSHLGFKTGNKKIQTETKLFLDRSDNSFKFYNTGVLPYSKDTLHNAGYVKYGLLQEMYFRPKASSVFSFVLWHQQADRLHPPLMTDYRGKHEEKQYDKSTKAVLSWNKFLNRWALKFKSGVNSSSLGYYLKHITEAGDITSFDTDSRYYVWENKINLDCEINNNWNLFSGLEGTYSNVDVNDIKLSTGYDTERNEFAVFARLAAKMTSHINSSFIFRQEIVDGEICPVIPSFALDWKLGKPGRHWLLTLNLSRNYHQPTLNDLYWVPGGNPDLKPEKGLSSDLSLNLDQSFGKHFLNVNVSGFFSLINDWIIWQPGKFRYWTPKNLQKVCSRGVEVNSRLDLRYSDLSFSIRPGFALVLTTNESDNDEFKLFDGYQLIYVPKHKFNALVSASYKKWFFNFHNDYTSKMYTTTDNSSYERPVGHYMLSNLFFGRKVHIKNCFLEVQFKIENLFNVDYQSILWRAMPGRSYSFALKFRGMQFRD